MNLPAKGTPRILLLAALVNTVGNGAYLTTSALFLTRSVGLTAGQVAVGLSIAAMAGMALTTPMGYLVDRRGAREVQVATLIVLGATFAAMTQVRHLWQFAVLACLMAIGDGAVKAANGAMIAGAVPPEERVRTRAFLRSANNAGIGLGTLLGSIPLALDSRPGYLAVLLLNAVSFLGAALIVQRADKVAAVARPSGRRMAALRDRPFLTFAMVDGFVGALYNQLLALALPLWLVAYTQGPAILVSAVLLVNTIGCVTLQVRASRGTTTAAEAAPTARRGAFVVGASCVLFGLTAGLSAWLVGVVVIGAAVVHLLGELWISSASFAVVFDLAPDWAQGQYQGVHQTGRQIGNMAAPPVLTALVIGWGVPGWLAVGAIFAAVGLVVPHIIRWGLRERRFAQSTMAKAA